MLNQYKHNYISQKHEAGYRFYNFIDQTIVQLISSIQLKKSVYNIVELVMSHCVLTRQNENHGLTVTKGME